MFKFFPTPTSTVQIVLLKVERYRELDSAKKREREAWKLYRTYISIGAPHELNLDILSRKVRLLTVRAKLICAGGLTKGRTNIFDFELVAATNNRF